MTTLFAAALLAADAFTGDGLSWPLVTAAILFALLDLGARLTAGERRAGNPTLDAAGIDPSDDVAVLAYMAEAHAALSADMYAFIHARTDFEVPDAHQ
jgi:hypothetical protein